jgi:hypothetical protein
MRMHVMCHCMYREDFYSVDHFQGSACHSDWRNAGCEVYTNSGHESECLIADNIRNEWK